MNISLEKVNKSFGKSHVIKNISFNIKSGEIVCFLGPSGAGKTTAIRLIIGAIAADSGMIKFDDIVVPNLPLLKSIGFMPQNDALYEDLTCEDNLNFFAGLYGMKKEDIKRRISDTLLLVGLDNERKKYVKNFSGGMKKRLSLAAALIHEPDVLLLDEPTIGIDPVLRRTIWDQFKTMRQAGRTIIVSTHVMDEVSECDRAALIYDGELIRYNTVETLLAETKSGKIEELFFIAAKEGKEGMAV